MRKSAFPLTCATILLCGCSAANAAEVDPTNDVHCAALSAGFRGMVEIYGAPPRQKAAVVFVDEWYGRKLVAAAKVRGRDSVMAEAMPISKAFDADKASLQDEYVSCGERAVEEAGLND